MMRKRFIGFWVVIALLSCWTNDATAQAPGDANAGNEGRGRDIATYCKKFDQTSAPCDAYVAEYFGQKSDLIVSIVNSIDRQKDRARAEAAFSKHADRWLTGVLIFLAFITTLSAAVARTYRDMVDRKRLRDVIGLVPIGASALVTMFATFSAYYKFDEVRAQNSNVANGLAKLQSEINFELIELVVEAREDELSVQDIRQWRSQLQETMDKYTPIKPVKALVGGSQKSGS